MKFWIGLTFAMLSGALAQTMKPGDDMVPGGIVAGGIPLNFEAAANVAFDPSGKARTLKVDNDGNVICVMPWAMTDSFGIIHNVK